MNNFNAFLTPEDYKARGSEVPIKVLRTRSEKSGTCCNCGEHIWRLVDNGLCFSCTTGESDAGEDYEIGEWHP